MSKVGSISHTDKKARMRVRLLQAHGRNCHWCGVRMTWPDGQPVAKTDMTIEHFIPASKGGGSHFENLRLACLECNNEEVGLQWIRDRKWSCFLGGNTSSTGGFTILSKITLVT